MRSPSCSLVPSQLSLRLKWSLIAHSASVSLVWTKDTAALTQLDHLVLMSPVSTDDTSWRAVSMETVYAQNLPLESSTVRQISREWFAEDAFRLEIIMRFVFMSEPKQSWPWGYGRLKQRSDKATLSWLACTIFIQKEVKKGHAFVPNNAGTDNSSTRANTAYRGSLNPCTFPGHNSL